MAILVGFGVNASAPLFINHPEDFSAVITTGGGGPATIQLGAYCQQVRHRFNFKLTSLDLTTATKIRLKYGMLPNNFIYNTSQPLPNNLFQNQVTQESQIYEINLPQIINGNEEIMLPVGASKSWTSGTISVQRTASDIWLIMMKGIIHFAPVIEEETTNNIPNTDLSFFKANQSCKLVFQIETYNSINQLVSNSDASFLSQVQPSTPGVYLSGGFFNRSGFVGHLDSTDNYSRPPLMSLLSFSKNGNQIEIKLNSVLGNSGTPNWRLLQIIFLKKTSKFSFDPNLNFIQNLKMEWVIVRADVFTNQNPISTSPSNYILKANGNYVVAYASNVYTLKFDINSFNTDDYYIFINHSNINGVAYTFGTAGRTCVFCAYFPPTIAPTLKINKGVKINQKIEITQDREYFNFDSTTNEFAPEINLVAQDVEANLKFPNNWYRPNKMSDDQPIDIYHKGFPIITNLKLRLEEWDKNTVKGSALGASGLLNDYAQSFISDIVGQYYLPTAGQVVLALSAYLGKNEPVTFPTINYCYLDQQGLRKNLFVNFYQNGAFSGTGTFVPVIKTVFILEQIFKNLGWEFTHDLTDHRKYICTISNVALRVNTDSTLLNIYIKDYLPNVTFSKFIADCRKLFCGWFDFDNRRKKVTFVSFQNLFGSTFKQNNYTDFTHKIQNIFGRKSDQQNFIFGFENSNLDILQKDNKTNLENYVYFTSVLDTLPSPTLEIKQSRLLYLVLKTNQYYYVDLVDGVYKWLLWSDGNLKYNSEGTDITPSMMVPRTSNVTITEFDGLSISNSGGNIRITFAVNVQTLGILSTDLVQIITPDAYAGSFVNITNSIGANTKHIDINQTYIQNESGVKIQVYRQHDIIFANIGVDLNGRKNRTFSSPEELANPATIESPHYVAIYQGLQRRQNSATDTYPFIAGSNYNILGTKTSVNLALRLYGVDSIYQYYELLDRVQVEQYRAKVTFSALDIAKSLDYYFRFQSILFLLKRATYQIGSNELGEGEIEFYKLFFE